MYRVHVVTRISETDPCGEFTCNTDKFKLFLDDIGVTTSGEDEFEENYSCDAKEYMKALRKLRCWLRNPNSKAVEKWIGSLFISAGCLKEEIEKLMANSDFEVALVKLVDAMTYFYKKRDRKSSYIYFEVY